MTRPVRDPSEAARERTKWDARHGEAGALVPSEIPFLDAVASLLPARGRALDLAAGRGRVSLWLARHGLATTACDISGVGLAIAREAATRAGHALEVEVLDFAAEEPPRGPFDVITCFHYLDWPLFSRLEAHLAHGGLLAIEVATVTNLERHAHPSRRFLAEPGRLREAFEGLDVLRYEEGWFDDRCVARLLARRDR
ncbi:MAG: methyltransferase domain-containing protein [Polyangiaceae bacterium]|nr:methyltransferase domain-containing protein [Polyangiaceae bacterium]